MRALLTLSTIYYAILFVLFTAGIYTPTDVTVAITLLQSAGMFLLLRMEAN